MSRSHQTEFRNAPTQAEASRRNEPLYPPISPCRSRWRYDHKGTVGLQHIKTSRRAFIVLLSSRYLSTTFIFRSNAPHPTPFQSRSSNGSLLRSLRHTRRLDQLPREGHRLQPNAMDSSRLYHRNRPHPARAQGLPPPQLHPTQRTTPNRSHPHRAIGLGSRIDGPGPGLSHRAVYPAAG